MPTTTPFAHRLSPGLIAGSLPLLALSDRLNALFVTLAVLLVVTVVARIVAVALRTHFAQTHTQLRFVVLLMVATAATGLLIEIGLALNYALVAEPGLYALLIAVNPAVYVIALREDDARYALPRTLALALVPAAVGLFVALIRMPAAHFSLLAHPASALFLAAAAIALWRAFVRTDSDPAESP